MIYAIIAVAVILVIALVIGLVKGYIRTKTWATEYLFAVVLSVLIFSIADVSSMALWVQAALKIGVVVVFILLFAFLSARGKALFRKCVAKAQKRSYYAQYGDREENTLQILNAIENGDAKEYRRLTKRKFKESRGGVGVADRICGAVTLVIKAAVILGIVASVVLMALQFTQMPFVDKYLGDVYLSGAWKFFSRFLMDAYVIGILFFAIRSGYRSGAVSALWMLAVLALIVGAAYLSFWLCFNVESFASVAQSLDRTLSSFTSAVAEFASGVGMNVTSQQIAQGILAAIIFVVLLIIIIIVGVVVSGIIQRAREGKAFGVVDGVFGAVVSFAVVAFILLMVGAVLYTLSDLTFMDLFNSYMFCDADGETKSVAIASVFYDCNPLNSWSFIVNLPVRGWFTA